MAFLLPVALYLLLLGSFHRRSTPLPLSGTWDFIGLLFAASGFLLFTGPALISSLSQRWRMFWLFGSPASDPAEWTWYFLATCYFTVVVGGCAYRFWRVQGQTAVYNIDPDQLHAAVDTTCEHLGVSVLRTGDFYVFEEPEVIEAAPTAKTAIATGSGTVQVSTTPVPAARTVSDAGVTLEVDTFAALRHATLTWEPSATPIRGEFEAELRRVLADSPTTPSDLGGTLFLLGTMLLALTLVGAIALFFLRILSVM
jgi:hypothetical protein